MLHVQKLKLNEIKEIYDTHMQEAFPQSELRPYQNIEKLYKEGNYVCYGLYKDGVLAAYAYFSQTKNRKYILLDYYAVLNGMRGTGIGSRFFALLREKLKTLDGILLEVESTESAKNAAEFEIRRKRIAFYERNGCEKTDVKCLLYGVDFSIMAMPIAAPVPNAARILLELENIYHVMFDEALYNRVCHPFIRELS